MEASDATAIMAAEARAATDANAQAEREANKTTLRQVLVVRHASFLTCASQIKLS